MTRVLVAGAAAAAACVVLQRRSAAETARWATLLRIVARAGRDMNRLGSEEVLEGVVGAVRAMGFDSANLSIIDEAAGTYRVIHAHGMPADYVDSVHPATIGMTGMVRAKRGTVAAADYGTQATAVPRLAQVGFTSAVGSPIWVGGELAGVLVGGSKRHRKLRGEEVEAFELLAAHAGVALENAARFEELERSRAQIRHQAEHDALTGLANRRLFRERIEATRSGALLFIDLDGFKGVNDFSATPRGTSCCGSSPNACAAACVPATPPRAWAATSSPCCSRARTPTPPRPPRSGSARRSTRRCDSTAAW